MKRSINRWTMSLATAGVLVLPVTSFAKASQEPAPQQQQQPQQQPQPAQPQPAQPQPEQPPAQPPAQPQPQPAQPQPAQPQPAQPQPTEPQTPRPTTSAAQPTADQAASPEEHLRQAQDAVKAISANAVPAKNRSDLAKLKQHLSNLEKMGSAPGATAEPASPAAGKSANAPKANWGTEVAAIDKIISEMIGSETSAPATSTPGATGTSGAAKSSTAIDEATRAKLMEVRTHITAYAAGRAGASSTPKSEETPSAAAPTAAAAPSATASPATASPTAASPEPSAASPATQSPAAGAQNSPATQPDPNAPTQQPNAGQQPAAAGQASTGAQPPVNADEAHRHLVAARDTLSQLTQLPAAAQLSGEARTQVAQLISNFNELIGNPPDWRASYQKVAANMTTLLGPDNTDAEAQGGAAAATPGATPAPGATPTPSATPGAVGTAGTASMELDPSIRAKLVEFRRSLSQFEKAAGGK